MLAMPMILVPCRDSLLALPTQLRAWNHESSKDRSAHQTISFQKSKNCNESSALIEGGTMNKPLQEQMSAEVQIMGDCYLPHVHEPHHNTSGTTDDAMSRKETVVHVLTTFMIVFVAYVGATKAPGVAAVWSVCGSSMAFIIAFILPTACYIKLRHVRKGHTHRIIMASWVLLVLSVMGAIACTAQTFWRFF
jgi:hypothetical protein